MNYLLLTQPKAEAYSSALWGISRPPAVRGDRDTQLYTSWLTHPETGAQALFVPDDTRPVHPDADLATLMSLIQPAVTADELVAIEAIVEQRRGSRISFKALVEASPSLSANLRTREQLEADGWFQADITTHL